MNAISKLIEILEHTPKSNQIVEFIKLAESESSVDITKQIDLLTGVWELRWSTSNSPLLNYSPLLDLSLIHISEPTRPY